MNIAANEHKNGIFAQLISWMAKGWEGASESEMLAALGTDTIRAIAGDCGIRPDQLIQLAKAGPHAADEMPRLMKALGIDPVEVELRYREQFRAMQVECASCSAKQTCRKDLDDHTVQQNFQSYCCNAENMNWLRATPTVLAE